MLWVRKAEWEKKRKEKKNCEFKVVGIYMVELIL
jgi:hypothetical protein